jgi:hypothetical protein
MVINEGLLPSEKISCTKYRTMYRATLSPLGILDFLLIRMSDEALTRLQRRLENDELA